VAAKLVLLREFAVITPADPVLAIFVAALRCSRTLVRLAPTLAQSLGENRALKAGILKGLAVVLKGHISVERLQLRVISEVSRANLHLLVGRQNPTRAWAAWIWVIAPPVSCMYGDRLRGVICG
jgi:hypothetical protein